MLHTEEILQSWKRLFGKGCLSAILTMLSFSQVNRDEDHAPQRCATRAPIR
jgi:hypothetical protein